MRVLSFTILCLFMAVYVLADDDATDDFVLGERKEDDRLVFQKLYIIRPTIFNHIPTIKIRVNAFKNELLTHIKVISKGNSQVTTTVLRGKIGERFLLLRVEGKPKEILSVTVEVYAAPAAPPPTVSPTDAPTEAPTDAPTAAPTEAPTAAPTEAPTAAPTEAPTDAPTEAPNDDASADDAPADD